MKHKTIVSLMLAAAGIAVAAAPEIKINNVAAECGFQENNDGWSCSYSATLTEPKQAGKEIQLSSGWKKHPKHAHIAGYNGDITWKIKAPGPVTSLQMSCEMTNFADSAKRKVFLAYSLNGADFREIAVREFGSGKVVLEKEITLPENRGFLWIRFGRTLADGDSNGKHGFVLFQKIGFALKRKPLPAMRSSPVQEQKDSASPNRLKEVFPTGVFWPWERTKMNADYAKMELWQFVEFTMKTLKEHGCDTLWFVNLPSSNMPKILTIAEKHGMRVLLNTDLIDAFYSGAGSLKTLQRHAESTVNRLGDYPALLGYVLKDEPLLCSLESCNYFYELMRKADPSRDSVAVVMNRQSPTFLKESVLPVICTDIYYFGHDKSTNIPNPAPVSKAEFTAGVDGYNRLAEQYGKHSWFMGQMFGDVWGRHYRKNDRMIVYPGSYLHWRMPTEAETRWQIWESVRLGSKGVFFYVLYPPIPLSVPPETVKNGTPEAKLVASMDRLAKTAAGWKHQPLTEKIQEIDPGEGMVQPGGAPTPQMREMGKVFQILRKNEALLLHQKRAAFPVFFPGDAFTDTATFDAGDHKRRGVIVNRDTDRRQTLTVLLPSNVVKVRNLNTGGELALSRKGDHFKQFQITLEPGDGILAEAEFADQIPGMSLCREMFDQQSIHRLKRHADTEIFHRGNYGVDFPRALRWKKPAEEPAAVLENLTNRKSAQNTFAMNLNSRGKDGTIYCLTQGKLSASAVKAVIAPETRGEQTNVSYLADSNFTNAAKKKNDSAQKIVIQERDFQQPAVVPPGTTSLEFYLGPQDFIDEILVWFVPAAK